MTNEEAKDYIREWCPYDRQEEIIKALEQEPCEDAISRQAVQNYVESHIQEINTGYGDLNNHTNRILRMIVDGIGNMPSIQPKPKTDILDKIRAEIKEVQTYKMFEGEDTVYVERKDVLAIIDKYKAESEE